MRTTLGTSSAYVVNRRSDAASIGRRIRRLASPVPYGLMTWLHARLTAESPLARDAVIAGLLVIAGLAELALRGLLQPREIAGALMMTVPLIWRRRAPPASAVLVAAAVALSGRTPTDLHLILAALPFAMYSLGAHASNRAAAAGLTVALIV